MKRNIAFTLNGRRVAVNTDDRRMLIWVLVHEIGLTETRFGCGEGSCGACSVLVDRRAERSCLLQVHEVEGREVTTVEGLAERDDLQPLLEAIDQHAGLECDFCTPGMVFNAYSLLLANPNPSKEQILIHVDRSMCRCGGAPGIVRAIQEAANG